tara:strand:- start:9189 stop:9365 length:177 start_codon:yes stop_codon:yes gene_type:complete
MLPVLINKAFHVTLGFNMGLIKPHGLDQLLAFATPPAIVFGSKRKGPLVQFKVRVHDD